MANWIFIDGTMIITGVYVNDRNILIEWTLHFYVWV